MIILFFDLIKMVKYNYKRNKLEQLKSFCAVVECGNVTEASKVLDFSQSTLSMQVISLEEDLGIKLFDREKNKLKLNHFGKKFYRDAKKLLNDVEKTYHFKLTYKLSKWSVLLLKLKKLFSFIRKASKKKAKQTIVQKLILFGIFIIVIITISALYLYHTNYFFDRILYKKASPIIQEIMTTGHYHALESNACPTKIMQITEDMYGLILDLVKDKRFQKLPITGFVVSDGPLSETKMTGDQEIDGVFGGVRVCENFNRYKKIVNFFNHMKEIFKLNPNAKIYTLYYEDLSKLLNSDHFLENVTRYPNQLFSIKIEKPHDINNVKGWVIKKGRYYYVVTFLNIITTNQILTTKNPIKKTDRQVFWQKLTKDQLIKYENGFYWRLIKTYHIDVD